MNAEPHPWTPDLGDAISSAAEPLIEDGEVIVAWIVLAATRTHRDGGTVVVLPSDNALPAWQVKGILADALDSVRRQCTCSPGYEDGDGGESGPRHVA